MSGGWKSYLGSTLKHIGLGALGIILDTAGTIPVQPGSKGAVAIGIGAAIVGSWLREVGQAHKQERQIEATKENTEAVLEK